MKINLLKDKYTKLKSNMISWSKDNLLGLFVFNLILMLLILLHSAGYFSPYFPISINLIVFIAIILAIPIFGAKSSAIFSIALFFWIFAAILRIVNIEVWAERTAIYALQSLAIGIILQFFEGNGFRTDKQ